MQCSYSQPRSGSEERVLGLSGGEKGGSRVGEMVGPAEDRKRTGTRWGGETGRRKMTNRVQMLT